MNLTNRCPNACDFCLRTHGPGVGDAESLWLDREPTRDEIWEDLSKRDLNAYPELIFCGYGEPTCRLEDMLWLCGKVRQASHISIRVNTNGLSDLINGRKTASEFDGLVDIISISLNASTPEKYQELCHSQFGLDALPAILCLRRRSRSASAWQGKPALYSGYAPILRINISRKPFRNKFIRL